MSPFCFLLFLVFIAPLAASLSQRHHKVIIVGAGMSGIMAAKKLSENGVDDFLILEGSDRIGGRMHKREFGGKTVEIGANWIEGVGGLHLNPLLELAHESGLRTFFFDYSNISSNYFDSNGKAIPLSEVLDITKKQEASNKFSTNLVATIRANNEEDVSVLEAHRIFGYVPETPLEMAVDYVDFDMEMAEPPRVTSLKSVTPLPTNSYYGASSRFVADERGYEQLVHGLGGKFLKSVDGRLTDGRLILRKVVREIHYRDDCVHVFVEDGTSYSAEYVILSISLGVLQSKLIRFKPELPRWKILSMFKFDMAIYMKIFLKFPHIFWPSGPGTEVFSYASERRGYYNCWEHLEKQYPGSNILFVTVTDDEARRIERQSDNVTKDEAMDVLRKIFGPEIPDALDILVPRWGMDRLQRGSYSNWPIGVTDDDFNKLKAPVGRIYFTGEYTSLHYNGYVHGAYFAAKNASCHHHQEGGRYLQGRNYSLKVKTNQ
ncbi:polyamine oxidase 7-like isoform X3 [Nymphaea colorata]|nr:polyamine oxidase 7-like isoform X3 [Nymphaea colorata]